MDDREIIDLYFARNEMAIKETADKYGNYCTKIAKNIVNNDEDACECVNDTYLNTWDAIPPTRPSIFSAFLAKITRNLAFNVYRRNHAEKRGGGEISLVLDELDECVSGKENVENEIVRKELVDTINSFISTLEPLKRNIFVCRYWYSDSVKEIAKRFKMTESNVSVTLNRLRVKLKDYLVERGFEV